MKDEITLVCALVVVALCAAGIWSQRFRDNWAQFCGLAATLLGALMIGWHAATTEHTSTRVMILLIGLVLYGIGTARNAWRYGARPRADTQPMPHNDDWRGAS